MSDGFFSNVSLDLFQEGKMILPSNIPGLNLLFQETVIQKRRGKNREANYAVPLTDNIFIWVFSFFWGTKPIDAKHFFSDIKDT